MSFRDDTAPDCTITHNGGSLSYYLATDPQNPDLRMWQPSFLPENVQERQQGPLNYDDRPKAVSQPIAFEDFSGGAGLADAVPGTSTAVAYSYAQGVDASWGQLCLSPQRQSLSLLDASSAPTTDTITGMYASPTYGVFAWSATHIYKLTNGAFTRCAVAPSSAPVSMIEYGNASATYLFLALGDTTDAIYSTDSFATSTTVTGLQVSYFAVRGVSSTLPVLYSTTVSGATRTSTNPILFANWSLVDYIGSTGEHVHAITVANDLIWYLKQEGIWAFDGSTVQPLAPTQLLSRSNDAKSTITHSTGFIFTEYWNRVLMLNPFTFQLSRVWAPTNPELNGTISCIAADVRYLYIFAQNANGNTYLVKYDILANQPNPNGTSDTTGGAHTVAYLASTAVTCCTVVPAGIGGISTTNDTLVLASGTGLQYYLLPRDGYRPWEDSNYLFESTGGTLYSQWVDCGTMAYDKWINGMRIVMLNASGAQACVGSYAVDGGAYSSLLTANTNGVNVEVIGSTQVTFTRVSISLTLSTGDNRHTPRVIGCLLDVTPNPPRHRMWTLQLDLGDRQRPRSGGDGRPVAFRRAYDHLLRAVGSRCTFEDYFGSTFLVKVVNVSLSGVKRRVVQGDGRGQAVATAEVVIVEINQNGTVDDPMVWGDATGNGGTPWSMGYEWNGLV